MNLVASVADRGIVARSNVWMWKDDPETIDNWVFTVNSSVPYESFKIDISRFSEVHDPSNIFSVRSLCQGGGVHHEQARVLTQQHFI